MVVFCVLEFSSFRVFGFQGAGLSDCCVLRFGVLEFLGFRVQGSQISIT